jgi:hypothetical protein
MPALIRLSLETVNDQFYLGQLLFHLESDGENNHLFLSCTKEQRTLIASFVDHMIERYPNEIDKYGYTDEALRVYEIWTKA